MQTWQKYVQDDALVHLAHAPTLRTASILLDQHQGALARAHAAIELAVAEGRMDEAQARQKRLADLRPLAEHLVKPWRVALCGAPNVGKSSLKNALENIELRKGGYKRTMSGRIPRFVVITGHICICVS